MNAAHSIASLAQSPLQPEAKVERQGPRELEAFDASTINHLSPALLLQSRLATALETERDTARWPGYVRAPLIVGSAVAGWALIIVTATRLFH
jgi:hypothetical protein